MRIVALKNNLVTNYKSKRQINKKSCTYLELLKICGKLTEQIMSRYVKLSVMNNILSNSKRMETDEVG